MIGITRALKITYVIWRYWLFTFLPKPKQGWPKLLFALIPRGSHANRGVACVLSLEALGPVFVKFGQALSTRRDLLPPDASQTSSRNCKIRCRPFPATPQSKLSKMRQNKA